ncbi:hypothetical protein [Saccharothrix violaceirubra]|uniref:Uncharacterized protein n=1 Tax=Saccharothrix violaceirubra TaxID=413306 RepID=A0A7W7SXE7_9PSEU|nr:hypothetical protein [Saccharothrix violaceirubra]MBB4962743.1 hypothetical protein [Saccharothrix violaceirubra]
MSDIKERFAEVVDGMVRDTAPRLFAVVQIYGDHADGRIAAWGMAFPGHVEAVSTEGSLHLSLRDTESITRAFTAPEEHLTATVVWLPAVNERLSDIDGFDHPEEGSAWW